MATIVEAGGTARWAKTLFVPCSPAEPLQRSMDKLKDHLTELGAKGITSVLLCDNQGQRDRLWEMLGNEHGTLGVGLVSAGFTMPSAGLAVLTDHEIFARYRRRRRRLRRTGGMSVAELSQLKPGDYVVHEDHGVGVYKGMKRLTLGGQETDCLELSYADKDTLYVPVHQLSLVSRYAAGDGARPGLHRRGSAQWQKTKSRAKKAIQEMAEELLRAYAARHALPGHAFKPDTVWQRELEASFPYDETPDQLKAIEDVRADMETASPMDRLICGDVGYGKTEVAIRAAFKAVQDGKQVAVLVPTTILATQHGLTFRERFADFPVKVEVLSRFRTAKEVKDVLARLERRDVDVLIGTHASPVEQGREVPRPRARRDRRRAPLRRGAEGEDPPAHAHRGRARDDRDADSAHAQPVARRRARHERDRDAAAEPTAGAHRSARVRSRDDHRRDPARDRPRRAGVLRAVRAARLETSV